MLRTHTCNALNTKNIHQKVTLCGWVQYIRNKGNIIWVDLRDHYGITQLVAEIAKSSPEVITQIQQLQREDVIQITGIVIERSAKNKAICTGDIEVKVTAITMLNQSKILPFPIHDKQEISEAIRMQYRYLDLRRKTLQDNLILKHHVIQQVNQFLSEHHFLNLETPHLIKSTPEGARDFLVPARQFKEHFYALPQSPQILKQLFMVAGFDRYYQIAKCFRDEDLRADRQPEFTQIDCEMAFVEQEDVLNLFEKLIQKIFKKIKNIDLPSFPRISYAQAIKMYGTDKPDLRWGMPFIAIKDRLPEHEFLPWQNQAHIAGIVVDDKENFYSRKKIDQIKKAIEVISPEIAHRLVYIKYAKSRTIKSSVDKFFTTEQLQLLLNNMQAKPSSLVCILSGSYNATQQALATLRQVIIQNKILQKQHPEKKFSPAWITDFPLFSWDNTLKKYTAMHHPFTAPQLHQKDWDKLDHQPERVMAQAYDLVINGVEIGGGSLRIHQSMLQKKIFNILGFTPEDMKTQFGFFLDALQYGTPPHGGIAIGLDRLCAIIIEKNTIRDFIPFPKNHQGKDVMMEAPSII